MALGSGTFGAIGGAVSDLFAADAYRTRAQGNRIQSQTYDLAQDLSMQNAQFTRTSTAIKQFQATRGIETVMGQQAADVAGSGFASSGTALDLMRDSASQGALHKAVLGQQGLIEEAGYNEQAKSYRLMSESAMMAAAADEHAATGAGISAWLKGAAALGSLIPGFSLPSFGGEGGEDDTEGGSPGGRLPEQA